MSVEPLIDVGLRPWSEGDLPLLERVLGDPAMTEHLGGPKTPEQLRQRHRRYLTGQPGQGGMFVIVVGPAATPAGSIGFWEREWQGQSVW